MSTMKRFRCTWFALVLLLTMAGVVWADRVVSPAPDAKVAISPLMLPLVLKQIRLPLFDGLSLRWDGEGIIRTSETSYTVGVHMTRDLDGMDEHGSLFQVDTLGLDESRLPGPLD
jgi:hypothetical protein